MEKTGSGGAAAPWKRGGATTPLRKKFQHVDRALKVWFFGRGATICSRKNEKKMCRHTFEKKRCNHTILEEKRGPKKFILLGEEENWQTILEREDWQLRH